MDYCVVTVPSVQVIVSPDANEPGGQSTLAQSETVPGYCIVRILLQRSKVPL